MRPLRELSARLGSRGSRSFVAKIFLKLWHRAFPISFNEAEEEAERCLDPGLQSTF